MAVIEDRQVFLGVIAQLKGGQSCQNREVYERGTIIL